MLLDKTIDSQKTCVPLNKKGTRKAMSKPTELNDKVQESTEPNRNPSIFGNLTLMKPINRGLNNSRQQVSGNLEGPKWSLKCS